MFIRFVSISGFVELIPYKIPGSIEGTFHIHNPYYSTSKAFPIVVDLLEQLPLNRGPNYPVVRHVGTEVDLFLQLSGQLLGQIFRATTHHFSHNGGGANFASLRG
uniref:(northern house mosquito) hypothetical protein n=1 Tax=Culex pipiens TaxID=7175 RepID=A0A8D8HAY3_CULPI